MNGRTFAASVVCFLIGCDNRGSPPAPDPSTASADISASTFAESFEFVVPLQTGLESSAARWQLNPPVIDGFSDPNRIAYDQIFFQVVEELFLQALGKGVVEDGFGVASYDIRTDTGIVQGTWGAHNREFGRHFRADQLIGFLKKRVSGERAVLTYVVRDARFARYLRSGPKYPEHLSWPTLPSHWERDVCGVINLLGGVRIVEALPCLLELLNDESEHIRREASKAIVEIAFGQPTISPATFESVLQNWDGPSFDDTRSRTAAGFLARTSKPAVARLIKAAQSPHVRWRWLAVSAFMDVDGPNDEVLGVLSQLLFDSDPEVREMAVWSIEAMGNHARDAESVLRAIHGNDPNLREAVASALIEIGASSRDEWDANGNPASAKQTPSTELVRPREAPPLRHFHRGHGLAPGDSPL